MPPYLGNLTEDQTIHFLWSTYGADGASITRATNGTVSVYKANGTTQSTAGVTDTEDFDALTGIHLCTIDTSADAFYAVANDYTVVLSAATVDGKTVNAVLALFSIENRFIEADVTKVAGAAVSTTTAQLGVNVVQISGDATAADNLEAATDGGTYNVGGGAVVAASVTGAVGSVTGAVGSVTGNVGGSVGSIATGGIVAASFAASAITASAIASDAIAAAKIASNAITSAKFAAGAIDEAALNADAVDEILDEVVEGTLTLRQVLRILLAVLAGKSGGGGTTTDTFRDVADSKDRVSATVNASGNRTAITLDGS